MRIGEVAQIVGISARSIRHYHRLGVLADDLEMRALDGQGPTRAIVAPISSWSSVGNGPLPTLVV